MIRSRVSKDGKVAIPVVYRKQLNLKQDQEVLFDYSEGHLTIISLTNVLSQARQMVKQYHPSDDSLIDKLIAERREEALSE